MWIAPIPLSDSEFKKLEDKLNNMGLVPPPPPKATRDQLEKIRPEPSVGYTASGDIKLVWPFSAKTTRLLVWWGIIGLAVLIVLILR